VDTAKKGIDGGGPVTEAEIESSHAWGSRLLQDPKAAVLRLMDFEMRRVRCRDGFQTPAGPEKTRAHPSGRHLKPIT